VVRGGAGKGIGGGNKFDNMGDGRGAWEHELKSSDGGVLGVATNTFWERSNGFGLEPLGVVQPFACC